MSRQGAKNPCANKVPNPFGSPAKLLGVIQTVLVCLFPSRNGAQGESNPHEGRCAFRSFTQDWLRQTGAKHLRFKANRAASPAPSIMRVLPVSGTAEPPPPLPVFSCCGTEMVSSSNVTAPVSANNRPPMVEPVFTVIDESAIMLPSNSVPVPSVAELPICQKTLMPGADGSLIVTTELPDAVVRVDPIWKTKTESAFPWSLSVSIPVSCAEDAKW